MMPEPTTAASSNAVPSNSPVSICEKGADVGNAEVRPNCTERLSEFVGVSSCKIGQVGEDVGTPESISHRRVFMDMVDSDATFPEVMPHAPRVRVGDLIVTLAPLPVSIIRTAEL
jgi:hypothetical protein